jgi:hypothetical protein
MADQGAGAAVDDDAADDRGARAPGRGVARPRALAVLDAQDRRLAGRTGGDQARPQRDGE